MFPYYYYYYYYYYYRTISDYLVVPGGDSAALSDGQVAVQVINSSDLHGNITSMSVTCCITDAAPSSHREHVHYFTRCCCS